MAASRRTLRTFDNKSGRNVFYRAAIHPMTAEPTARLVEEVARASSVSIYDPAGYFGDLAAIHDLSRWSVDGVYVQRFEEVGEDRGGFVTRPLTALPESGATLLLIADFDSAQAVQRLGPYLPAAPAILGFESLRLGPEFLTTAQTYLDPLNFVTDFLFFRDQDGLHTAVSTTNYWHGHGARDTRLWCRLFGADGAVLATWEQPLPQSASSIVLDSADVRRRFDLPAFTGSLFVHVIGTAAHDTLKYAVDIYDDSGAITSATHDSNPWAADFYAGLPAADTDQHVRLWVQNCYPTPIPAGAIGLRPIGVGEFQPVGPAIPPYGTAALDPTLPFPDVRWPAQFEIKADRYCCRPRYEIAYGANLRSIAHVNVERGDLKAADDLPDATRLLGKGFILPAPLLPVEDWSTVMLPTPMATWQAESALMLRIYDATGQQIAEERLGRRGRNEQPLVALDSVLGNAAARLAGGHGHIEVGYDFEAGAKGDGWIHAIFRYTRRQDGRTAETSFGSHLFNVPAIWRNEPNSYLGKPPGLSTRLYLRLVDRPGRVMCHLTYPTSGKWRSHSDTELILHAADGSEVARRRLAIPCSGSALIDTQSLFDAEELAAAAKGGYVIIRDTTCRLFGYHIFLGDRGGFALDHMFGF